MTDPKAMDEMPSYIWAHKKRFLECSRNKIGLSPEFHETRYVHESRETELLAEIGRLRADIRLIARAIVKRNNGVNDTIWIHDFVPIGDFIQCSLDEDIDWSALADEVNADTIRGCE